MPLSAKGQRLDVYLQRQIPQLSRSNIKRLMEQGQVRVEGHAIKPSFPLKGGEKLKLVIPPPEPLDLVPEAIPLEILYEDRDLIVLNKPEGMVVHPGAGVKKGTLVHAVLHHCRDLSGIGGKIRPGIVHRLDKGTSGVLVIAKNDRAHAVLTERFKSREIKKTYLAFVWGKPTTSRGIIDRPLGRDPRDRKKISSRAKVGRQARTRYRLLETLGPISFLELVPETGRTHQIRVHLSEIGHPVVGDPTYGKGKRKLASLPKSLKDWVGKMNHPLLHALSLEFLHPLTEEPLKVTAPMRREMEDFYRQLEKEFGE